MGRDFPRVYHLSRSGRLFYYFFGGVAVALFGALAVYTGFFADREKEDAPLWVALLFLVFAAGGAWMIVAGRQIRVLLHADAIECVGVFMRKRMTRANIEGFRWCPMQYGPPYMALLARYDTGHKLRLPQFLDIDADFEAWLAGVDNLDAKEQQASLDEVLSDPGIQGSRDERLARLEKAKRVARALYWISLGAAGWLWLHPQPYLLAVGTCVLLPWLVVAMVARDGAVYRLNQKQNDAGANLLPAMMLPGFALLLRALMDISVLDWQKLLWFMVAATAACGAIMWSLVRELRKSLAAVSLLALLVAPYAYGTLDLANARFDRREPVPYAAQVLDQHVTTGKTTTYNLTLSPWGPRPEAGDAEVTKAFYHSVSKGERVCVYLHPGSLGVRWFEVWDCPGA